jgi:hypothetical protein
MSTGFKIEEHELSSSGGLSSLLGETKRNMGCAILIAAIEDYRGTDDQAHKSAALFLYPATAPYQDHYEWVVSMAAGVNAAWLRDALDGTRCQWDAERLQQKLKQRYQARVNAMDELSS